MNTGEYTNDSFIGQSHRTADPKIKEEIQELVARARPSRREQLKANPNDVNALYCRGVTRAQFAVYTASWSGHGFRRCAMPSGRATTTSACSNSTQIR